jgi:hypothetical protein
MKLRSAILPWVSAALLMLLFGLSVSNAQDHQQVGSHSRDDLTRSARSAIQQLGRENGFFNDATLKIGLPKKFAKADRILRTLGHQQKVDDLILAMNRAAELAVLQMQTPVLNAIQHMPVSDEHRASSDSFRQVSEKELAETLLAIIQANSEKSDLTRAYRNLASVLARYGIKSELITVERYVNTQALNALYRRIGEAEQQLRTQSATLAAPFASPVASFVASPIATTKISVH